jgi:hypothetical protein
MAHDLNKLPEGIRVSQRAPCNIRENITLFLVTVAVLILAALSNWLSLTSGLLLNEGSALVRVCWLFMASRASTSFQNQVYATLALGLDWVILGKCSRRSVTVTPASRCAGRC